MFITTFVNGQQMVSWKRINENLRYQEREKRGRKPEPTGAIIDSQSVKTTEAGGERGYNGSKCINGRKRHVVVDTVGNLLSVVVNAANSQDREGAKEAFSRLKEETLDSLQMIWADNGYRGPKFFDLDSRKTASRTGDCHCPS